MFTNTFPLLLVALSRLLDKTPAEVAPDRATVSAVLPMLPSPLAPSKHGGHRFSSSADNTLGAGPERPGPKPAREPPFVGRPLKQWLLGWLGARGRGNHL